MKFSPFFKKITLAVATVGMVIPQSNLLFAAETQSTTQKQQVLADVSLNAENKLVGQVVDGKGIARANSQVIIATAQGEVLNKVLTDKNGMFQADVTKGGIYTVAGSQASSQIRVWTNQVAPPNASHGVLVVDDAETTRGQLVERDGFLWRLVTKPDGSIAWVRVGVVGGVVTGAIIAASQQNSAS